MYQIESEINDHNTTNNPPQIFTTNSIQCQINKDTNKFNSFAQKLY